MSKYIYFCRMYSFLYVFDIDVTRNGNNLKLKVKSDFSLIKYGLINPIYTVLPYYVIIIIIIIFKRDFNTLLFAIAWAGKPGVKV